MKKMMKDREVWRPNLELLAHATQEKAGNYQKQKRIEKIIFGSRRFLLSYFEF